MKLRLLSWNVRGTNNCDKRKVIKALIKKKKGGFGLLTGNQDPGNVKGYYL